jgi:hypothetical protein
MIVGMCLVAGTAWAQSGPAAQPQAQPNQGAAANQPVNAQVMDISAASAKIVPTSFADRWVAVSGTTRTGAWYVYPKTPSSGQVKMSPRGNVFVSTARGSGVYGLDPSDEGAAHYIKLEIDAKRDRTYGVTCHTQLLSKWGVRVSAIPKLSLSRHGANGAALAAGLFTANISLGNAQTDQTVHMGSFKHFAPDGKVELRIARAPGNGDHYIFLYRCAVSEETPSTTYKPAQGDKA